MRRRDMVAVLVVVSACFGLGSCGGGGKSRASTTVGVDSSTTADASAGDTATTVAASGAGATSASTITVSPATGPLGTTFKLMAKGFPPGTQVAFHVTRPNKSTFVGPNHAVAADGTVSAVYSVTSANSVGTYTVQAIDADGAKATATFVVSGAATTTTIKRTTTTAHP